MFTVRGVLVEAVEVFGEHVLVQELESKEIYLVGFHDVDTVSDPIAQVSNIISLKGWKQCQEEKVENEKANFKKARINKRPRVTSPPKLRLVMAR